MNNSEKEKKMYQVGDYLVYKRNVCKVVELKEKYINDLDYFVLIPIKDKSLKIEIPTTAKGIRDLISKEKVEEIIKNIPKVQTIPVDDKTLEQEYKKLLNSGTHQDLIQIIKTTYLRNKERLAQKKKIGDKDAHYFEEAENNLYQEFSVVLGLTLEQTKDYVLKKVEKLV